MKMSALCSVSCVFPQGGLLVVQAEFLLLSPFCHCNFRSHFGSLASFSGDAEELYRVEDGPLLGASFSLSLLLSIIPCAFQHL